ncbi:unnamed protein product, partial [marine sediment metagenome]
MEKQAWRFQTDAQQVGSFRTWLKTTTDAKILTTDGLTGKPWTDTYVDSAYKKGMLRGYTDVHKEALAESSDFYQGTKKQFLHDAFGAPETISKLELVSTRVFEELKGINAAMAQGLQRELANGLVNGLGPKAIAKRMTDTISGLTKKRALVLARTETIYAHAEGQLDSFERLGVTQVGIMAEWKTAGDDLVCPLCNPLEGVVMTIKEARGLIPRHPNCRCAWIPADANTKEKGQVR